MRSKVRGHLLTPHAYRTSPKSVPGNERDRRREHSLHKLGCWSSVLLRPFVADQDFADTIAARSEATRQTPPLRHAPGSSASTNLYGPVNSKGGSEYE